MSNIFEIISKMLCTVNINAQIINILIMLKNWHKKQYLGKNAKSWNFRRVKPESKFFESLQTLIGAIKFVNVGNF